MTEKKRDYKKEYREYHGKPEQIAARSQRNQARAKVGLLLAIKENATTKTPFLTAEAIERTISELWQEEQTAPKEYDSNPDPLFFGIIILPSR